jgi:hypothetical protein
MAQRNCTELLQSVYCSCDISSCPWSWQLSSGFYFFVLRQKGPEARSYCNLQQHTFSTCWLTFKQMPFSWNGENVSSILLATPTFKWFSIVEGYSSAHYLTSWGCRAPQTSDQSLRLFKYVNTALLNILIAKAMAKVMTYFSWKQYDPDTFQLKTTRWIFTCLFCKQPG